MVIQKGVFQSGYRVLGPIRREVFEGVCEVCEVFGFCLCWMVVGFLSVFKGFWKNNQIRKV